MWWLIFHCAVIAALLLGYLFRHRLCNRRDVYVSSKITEAFDGFVIAQVSDFHDFPYVHQTDRLLRALRKANPGIIVLTGDLFNRRKPDSCEHAFGFVRAAVAICPVFMVQGNHECQIPSYERWHNALIASGTMVLDDEAITIYRAGHALRLIGMRQYFDTQMLTSLRMPDVMNVVLSHRPELAKQYARTGVDLVLTGHAHGGQMRFFGIPLYAPEQGVLPGYTAGMHPIGDTMLYISRGIGNTVKLPRLFCPPEWNLITLRSESGYRR